MEAALLLHGSLDQSPSPRRVKNPMKFIQQPLISRSYDNLWPTSNIHSTGLLQAPPLLLRHHSLRLPPPQPPLLPLPAAAHPRLSCPPPVNKSGTRTRNNSLTPAKKSKSFPNKNHKKQEKKLSRTSSDTGVISSTSPLRPDKIINEANYKAVENNVRVDVPAVFTISPPPSSLPLPTFSLRPKLRCNAAAAGAGTDTGPSDDLRRLLRLQ